MDIGRCLERIGYYGPIERTLETLRSLQAAFLLSVPFENLDIFLDRNIVLSSEDIYEKIVNRKRGGVCFERNIFFHDLLTALGFQVNFLSARMVKGSLSGPEFDHMVLLVTLNHEYLVDVGNGHFCRGPLRIDGTDRSSAEGHVYRVGTNCSSHVLYYSRDGKEWLRRFLFTLSPRSSSEFETMNSYHQTSPDSQFRRRRIVTLATEDGRISLLDRKLIFLSGGSRRSEELGSERQYIACLKKYFNIEIPGGDASQD